MGSGGGGEREAREGDIWKMPFLSMSMLTLLIESTDIHFDKIKGDLQLHLHNFDD